MAKLSSSLVLNKYILYLFGATDSEALSKDLKDSSFEGYDENNVSFFHHALMVKLYSNTTINQITNKSLNSFEILMIIHRK
ncbi:MAG: hypothetical protein Q7U86_04935 [Draconibacterium sp.]|nr:hypothetical protein [Draconibacterium sp.]